MSEPWTMDHVRTMSVFLLRRFLWRYSTYNLFGINTLSQYMMWMLSQKVMLSYEAMFFCALKCQTVQEIYIRWHCLVPPLTWYRHNGSGRRICISCSMILLSLCGLQSRLSLFANLLGIFHSDVSFHGPFMGCFVCYVVSLNFFHNMWCFKT
jgi:hypothetical protein